MQLSIMEASLYSCCHLLVEGQEESWDGSGFFVKVITDDERQSDLLVTCKHIIDGAEKISITVRRRIGNDPIRNPVFADVEMMIADCEIINHPTEDLCGIFITPFLFELREADGQWPVTYSYSINEICKSEDLDAFEEFIMFGYPSGVYDEVNNHPIIRRGVTASHPGFRYKGKEQFLVDCASHSGSSGSPIIRYGNLFYDRERQSYDVSLGPRLGLLGMLSDGIDDNGVHKQHLDLGIAISADAIISLIDDAKAYLQ